LKIVLATREMEVSHHLLALPEASTIKLFMAVKNAEKDVTSL